MIESRPKALEVAKPDFTEDKDIFHSEHVKHLHKAQAFVEETSKKRKAVEIKIPSGVVITTRPDRWEDHEKVMLRGAAAMSQAHKEE